MRKWLVSTLLMSLALGCATRDVSELQPGPSAIQLKSIPVSTNRDVDILFVVDNSDSMKDKQDNLAANFQAFTDVLQNISGGLPNIHLGVISSNVGVGGYSIGGCAGSGDGGTLQNTPRVSGCAPPADRYISDVDDGAGGRVKNYSGSLADTFTCIAQLGTKGCGFEHHFESMKRALDGSNPLNAGFLRDDALLAVIILADEDDCSAKDDSIFDPNPAYDNPTSKYGPLASFRCTEFGVKCDGQNLSRSPASYTSCQPRGDSYFWDSQHYVDFLKSLKKDPNQIFVSVIGGNTSPFAVGVNSDGNPVLEHSCTFTDPGGMTAVGDPGIRFHAFVNQFANGSYESVCQSDYTDSLTRIAQAVTQKLGTPCIEGSLNVTDVDPAPGLQLGCSVEDVVDPNTASERQTVLARCPMLDDHTPAAGAHDCWWAEVDAAACPSAQYPSSVALHVEQDTSSLPAGTYVVAQCVAD